MVSLLGTMSTAYNAAVTGASAVRAVRGAAQGAYNFYDMSNAEKYDLVMQYATTRNVAYAGLISAGVTAALANPVSRAALFSLIGASYSLTFLTAQLLIMGLYFAVTTGSQLAGPAASMLIGGAQMAVGGAQGVASMFSRGAKGAAPAVNAEVEQMIQELTTPVRNQQAVVQTMDEFVEQFLDTLPPAESQLMEEVFEGAQGQPVVTMTPAELREAFDSQSPAGSIATEALSHDELNQLMEDIVKDEASNRFNIDEFISEYFEDEAQSGVALPKVNMTSEQLNEIFEEGSQPKTPTVNKQVVMSAAQLDAVWSEVNVGEKALDAAWDSSVQPVAAKSTGSSLNPAKVVKVGLGLYAGFKLAKIAFDLLRKDAENIAEEGEKMVQEAEAKYGSTDEVDSVATYQEQQTYSFV